MFGRWFWIYNSFSPRIMSKIVWEVMMRKMRYELGSNRVPSELTQKNWILWCDFVILCSQITPETEKLHITSFPNHSKSPNHPRSHQKCPNHAFGAYYRYWALPNNFSPISPTQICVKFESITSRFESKYLKSNLVDITCENAPTLLELEVTFHNGSMGGSIIELNKSNNWNSTFLIDEIVCKHRKNVLILTLSAPLYVIEIDN